MSHHPLGAIISYNQKMRPQPTRTSTSAETKTPDICNLKIDKESLILDSAPVIFNFHIQYSNLTLSIKIQYSNSIFKFNIQYSNSTFKFNTEIQYSNSIFNIQYSIFVIQHSNSIFNIQLICVKLIPTNIQP